MTLQVDTQEQNNYECAKSSVCTSEQRTVSKYRTDFHHGRRREVGLPRAAASQICDQTHEARSANAFKYCRFSTFSYANKKTKQPVLA
jgi:hypothetical protein